MITKTIPDMLAELPPLRSNYAGAKLRRALAEIELLRKLLLDAEPHIYGNDSEQWLWLREKVLAITEWNHGGSISGKRDDWQRATK